MVFFVSSKESLTTSSQRYTGGYGERRSCTVPIKVALDIRLRRIIDVMKMKCLFI